MSDLALYLTQTGYHQIPLTGNGVGLFQTGGSIDNQPISVLIDTGAASTVIDRSLAERFGWALTPLPQRGGGAGGASLPLYLVEGRSLKLGGLTAQAAALIAMDLTHVNQSLAMKGATPIEAILGIDVFNAHAAVIDYGSRSLFLKRRPEMAQ